MAEPHRKSNRQQHRFVFPNLIITIGAEPKRMIRPVTQAVSRTRLSRRR